MRGHTFTEIFVPANAAPARGVAGGVRADISVVLARQDGQPDTAAGDAAIGTCTEVTVIAFPGVVI